MSSQVTTLTFFRYTSVRKELWAFAMMQLMHKHIKGAAGLEFYKLMGSGKQNFSPLPDWSEYALLQVWKEEENAHNFFSASKASKKYKAYSDEIWTVYLKNVTSKGKWSGRNPFKKHFDLDTKNPLIAVITRATIKTGKLRTFWRYVPKSQTYLENNSDLIFTKGIGEVPLTQMATFSIWKQADALKTFAYHHQAHKKAVLKTRELEWYKEELFSRFQPYKSVGTWKGKLMLEDFGI